MNNTMPQTLKGFRDFLPEEKRRRDYVTEKLRMVFSRFGFEPIETPTLEYSSLLMGKYGDEADQLVYRFTDRGERDVALRYDQTVPSARVLYQYQQELPRYFRRYQIQNVFRADKPQKGRYREFTQADCDIFGAPEPVADAEILAVLYSAYASVGLTDVILEYNDRQLLESVIAPFATEQVTFASITQSIDKLDKVSELEVSAELQQKGLAVDTIQSIFEVLKKTQPSSGVATIMNFATTLGVPNESLRFNPFLARGLDYYTGLIFEAKLPGVAGSLGAGGRYDRLIENLSGLSMPAIGFGLGFDRTVEVLSERNLLPTFAASATVLVTLFSESYASASMRTANLFRNAGIPTEIYPGFGSLGKQFKMADQKKIPFVIIIGDDEQASNVVRIKTMSDGSEQDLPIDAAIQFVLGASNKKE